MGLATGARFGPYEILQQLGQGGMGEVYLAQRKGPGSFVREVVIKRVLPDLAHDRSFIDMFLDEAAILARLTHSNIAQVYDFGQLDGQYYLVMEYVRGTSLAGLIGVGDGRRALPVEHAVRIVADAARGLEHAHNATGADGGLLGLIHRDVKTRNILVSFDGEVKLIDFGVARATSRQTETAPGITKGTPRFMSPEQCRALVLDARTDVFSLGAVLWEALTGQKLFAQSNHAELLRAIVSAPSPRPSSVQAGVPRDLDSIVLCALEKDRENRFRSAGEMANALELFLMEHRLMSSSSLLAELVAAARPAAGDAPGATHVTVALPPREAPGYDDGAQVPTVRTVARRPARARSGPVAGPVAAPAAPPDTEDIALASTLLQPDADPETQRAEPANGPVAAPTAPPDTEDIALASTLLQPDADPETQRAEPANDPVAAPAAPPDTEDIDLASTLLQSDVDPEAPTRVRPAFRPVGRDRPARDRLRPWIWVAALLAVAAAIALVLVSVDLAPRPAATTPGRLRPLLRPGETDATAIAAAERDAGRDARALGAPADAAAAADAAATTDATPPIEAGAPGADAAPQISPQPRPRPAVALGGRGLVTIDSRPWSVVSSRGRRLGETPVVEASLPPGPQPIVLTDEDGRVHRRTITVVPNAHTKVRFVLERAE